MSIIGMSIIGMSIISMSIISMSIISMSIISMSIISMSISLSLYLFAACHHQMLTEFDIMLSVGDRHHLWLWLELVDAGTIDSGTRKGALIYMLYVYCIFAIQTGELFFKQGNEALKNV